MYCVNENKDAKAHFAFFFNFSESVTTSDGYPRGYVSFAHFLFLFVKNYLIPD